MARTLLLALFASLLWGGNPLQEAIDKAPPGATVELPAGRFEGPVVVDKSLTLRGQGEKTVIDAKGKGTVLTLQSGGVRIENLTLAGSGRQRHTLDAALKLEGVEDVALEGCRIERSLFGVVAERSRNLRIRGNAIRSYDDPVVDNRGDGVRLWGCGDVVVADNRFRSGRDIAVTRSHDVRIEKNDVEGARYGVLMEMSRNVQVKENRIVRTYAGIYAKGGRNLTIAGNEVSRTRLETGVGILLAHGRDMRVHGNRIYGCAQAFYIDSSPAENGMRRFIERNVIADNVTAFHFHAAIRNNTIRYNDVFGNLDDVVLDIPKARRGGNEIAYNYWDRYRGFDRNGDGIGDTPYQVLIYADKLWQYDHHLKFFYATPVLSLLDFIERLAPLSEPDLLLEDPKPKMERNVGTRRRAPLQ